MVIRLDLPEEHLGGRKTKVGQNDLLNFFDRERLGGLGDIGRSGGIFALRRRGVVFLLQA